MQIVFDNGSQRRELDLRVNDPAATVADLIAALDPRGNPNRRLLIGDYLASPELGLTECGLHEGAVVQIAEWGRPAPPDQGRLSLEVIGGLDSGRRVPLDAGTRVLGREQGVDLVLKSHTISRRHAEVALLDDGGSITVKDLGSLNGTWIHGRPVTSPVTVPVGTTMQFGALQTIARPHRTDDRPMAVDPLRHVNAAGTIPFNRPPRPAPPPEHETIDLPEPPKQMSSSAAFNVVALLAPILLAGVFVFVLRQSPLFLAFILLSPIMVLGNWIQGKVRGKKSGRREGERFTQELGEFRKELYDIAAEEVVRLNRAHPDPAEVLRRVLLPSTQLWERRPHHHDFLRMRAGLGDVPWRPPTEELKKDPPEEVVQAVRETSVLHHAPVTVDLSGGGVVGIVGDRNAALAVARSLVGQAAAHHGPADLPMVMLARAEFARDWDWAKWLPHTRDPGGGSSRLLSADPELSNKMVEGWLKPESERDRGGKEKQGTTLFVVVDDESLTEGRRAPARTLLRGGAGPVAGIVIASTMDRLPAVCTTVIDMLGPDGEANLHLPQLGQRIDRFLACGMSDDTARDCARALARFEDPELVIIGAGLPDMIRLLPLLELDEVDADGILSRWKAGGLDPPPAGPIGMSEQGTFGVNLHSDGPHGLIGGTTGSGKSELLRSLVAGLAANVDPDHLTFVLIDFKGGAAFDECAKLPHTVGMVTDLDEALAERALRCLEAELKYRERVLRQAGAIDLPAYLRGGRAHEPLPRLVVVIDEFATLKAELPDFIDALVGVAQRGRSLGVHMVLATQRPQGAVSDNIRANTNLRIALRVQDDGDSTDIIDRNDAARIPRHAAGRAYVRLGAGEVVAIQSALSTAGRTGGLVAPLDLAPFGFGPTPRPPEPKRPTSDNGNKVTDLTLLVEAINEAHRRTGRPAPRRPWPEPLPSNVDLDQLLASAATPDPVAPEVTIALADDPDNQTQYPVGWRPSQGNLLVYGVGGSGTTTTLGTIALSLARLYPADNLHLYALDFGAGELDALLHLPHTGAVIGAGERERQMRLIRLLRGELDRRRDLEPDVRRAQPTIVVFVDNYPAFNAEYRDIAGMNLMDEFQRVFADGPEVSIYTVLTAERAGGIASSVASVVRQKIVMRLADQYDYGQFGVRSNTVPKFTPGGAIVAESKQVIQVAAPVDGLVWAGQRYGQIYPAPSRPPAPVGQLPTDIAIGQVTASAELDGRPWRIPLGIVEGSLGAGSLVVYEGEHALVAGPARSGKTSGLAAIVAISRQARPDLVVITLCPQRSPLPTMIAPDHEVSPDGLATELLPLLTLERPTLVLVDDAEAVDDANNVLAGLLGSHKPNLLVVAAGRSESLRGMFSHWSRTLRRSKLGVLLRPNTDLDGELLGVTLPRRVPVAMTVGRGFLVNSGEMEIIQLAHP
ncbi:MAG: FtsK/SpoIIIE domain-containing protein [Acidimicrobiales bacterium]